MYMKYIHGTQIVLATVAGIIGGAFLVVFALQNAAEISVTILTWHVALNTSLALMCAIALGAAVTILSFAPSFIRADRTIKRLEKEKKAVEEELAKYHITIPIAPPSVDASTLIMARRPLEPVNLPR